MAGKIVDTFLVYQFIKRLATPFNKWKAYELGIIDDEGKVLKKRKDLESQEEKNSWGYYDILVANLKKLLAKVPFGRSRLASFAAAALLLREYKNGGEEKSLEILEEELTSMYNELVELKEERVEEDAPANNAGGGNIAGIGVGPDGEPGVMPRKKKKYKKDNELGARKVTQAVGMLEK